MRLWSVAAAVLAAAPAAAQHHDHAAPIPSTATAEQEPGSAPAPSPPSDRYADRFWSPEAMARARAAMQREHGGMTTSMLLLDIAEIQPREGRDGYRFEGEGWWGGDINRFVAKFEGEGSFGERPEAIEVQALYSRAIDAYWNLQAGVRRDVRPSPQRSYATIGVEGLAPYWFQLEGALFLSDKGEVLVRTEASYDQRITNDLTLQPRAELDFAAQDVVATGVGSGLSSAEFGLRLRYQIAPEFAPYVGVSWERKFGDTARFARAAGESPSTSGVVIGVRGFF